LTLTADYLREAEHRARRFSGAYIGTSGTLAADVLRLIKERKEMSVTIDTLESANQALRDAVTNRLAGCKPAQEAAVGCLEDEAPAPTEIADAGEDAIPSDWILRGERELKAEPAVDMRQLGASISAAPADSLRPGSHEFLAVLDELKDLHLRKTLDYGVDEDALSNIRNSAEIVNVKPWAGCVLRMMDKMHRLKAFFRRGRCEFDGVEDTLKDIACYAAIALVLHRESDRP